MPGLTYQVRSSCITPSTKQILLALSPLLLWHYAVSDRSIQGSEIRSLVSIWSYLCYLQLLWFTIWAPSITKQKDCGQNGLSNYYILRGSFTYLRNEILSHYYLPSYNYIKSLQAALTSVSFRRLLPGMLKCWLPGLQVPPVQNSFPTHQENKPPWCFTIQRSYCALVLIFLLAQWTTAMVLPVTYFASWICAIYWAIKEAV